MSGLSEALFSSAIVTVVIVPVDGRWRMERWSGNASEMIQICAARAFGSWGQIATLVHKRDRGRHDW